MDLKVTGHGGQTNLNTGGYEISLPQNNMEVTKETKNYDNQNLNYNRQEEPYTEKDLHKAVNKLNNFLKDENTHAEYSVHEKFNIILIKIIDDKTKEVIMEVPPRKILDMVAKMCELVGIVFDKRA